MDFNFPKIEGFEWDEGNLGHIKNHNVNFRECEEIFVNKPLLINKDKAHSQIEVRFQVLGITNNRRGIFLAFTIRKNKIRVVSARDQNKSERVRLKRLGGEIV